MLHVLECCRTSAGLLQRCCRTAADLLQIMKAHCPEMLHTKFEVSRSHRLGARGDYPKSAPPPPTCDSVTCIAGLGPAKNKIYMGKKQTNWIKDYQFRSCNVNNILGALSASLPPLAMSHDRSKEMILVLLEYIGNILHAIL